MRIAIAYDCLFPATTGGGERQYRAFAEELERLGHDVLYLTADHGAEAMAEPGFVTAAVTGELDLYDDSGVRRTGAALRFAFGLFRHLVGRRRSLDAIIVSGLPVLNVFAARFALAGSGVRVIVDYLEVWGRRQWMDYAGAVTGFIAWMLQRLAIMLTPTATCHSRLTERRLRAEGMRKTILVSPGLIDDVGDPSFAREAEQPPYVLYAGRHIPDKRVESLPAAVSVARETIPELELVVLGTGPSQSLVVDAVDSVGGREWTRLPGFVSEDELDRLMAGAACLANPSRREGYGLVVVESSGHGTPVVLVDDPGNAATDLVEEGTNGYIAPDAGPRALGSAIVRAVQGGGALRSSTRRWYEDAVSTRTIRATVAAIAAHLSGDTAHLDPEDGPSGGSYD